MNDIPKSVRPDDDTIYVFANGLGHFLDRICCEWTNWSIDYLQTNDKYVNKGDPYEARHLALLHRACKKWAEQEETGE